jgi:cytolysin-activating lysine-acyltransferase
VDRESETDRARRVDRNPGEDNVIMTTDEGRGSGMSDETAAAPVERAGLTLAGALGEAVHLLTQSPAHKHLFLTDLDWAVIPALMLGQFRLFRSGGRVVGLALWASVSDEVDDRLKAGVSRLAPLDWKSGETLWLIDLVAPFGGAERMLKDLAEGALAGKNVRYWGVDEQGRRTFIERNNNA